MKFRLTRTSTRYHSGEKEYIELKSIQAILKFIKDKESPIIIDRDSSDGSYSIEIYDDYRE